LTFQNKRGVKTYKKNLGGTNLDILGDKFINLKFFKGILKLLGGHLSPLAYMWVRPWSHAYPHYCFWLRSCQKYFFSKNGFFFFLTFTNTLLLKKLKHNFLLEFFYNIKSKNLIKIYSIFNCKMLPF
jgi:hypothetical protein